MKKKQFAKLVENSAMRWDVFQSLCGNVITLLRA